MSGILSQITSTPDIGQQQVYLATAKTYYDNHRLKENLGVEIGQHITSTGPYQQLINSLQHVPTDPNQARMYPLAVMMGCTNLDSIAKEYAKAVASLNTSASLLDVTTVMQENKDLQDRVLQLTIQRDNLKENRDVAVLRDSTLRSGSDSISNHQVYLLGRPLRPASIPFLWALSVLFIGLGLLVFYTFFPYTIPPIDILLFEIYLFFASPYVWSILFGLASIVILFLSLHIAGIL